MTIIHHATLSALLAAVSWGTAAAATITSSPLSGLVTAPAGGTNGWGFTFQNGAGFAVLSFSDFEPVSPAGSYNDFIPNNFVVIAPQGSYSTPFDPNAGLGMGSFDVPLGTPVGTHIDGTITLFFDLYSADPSDPNSDAQILSLSNATSMNASIAVGAAVGAPEPSTLATMLCGAALVGLGACRRRRTEINRPPESHGRRTEQDCSTGRDNPPSGGDWTLQSHDWIWSSPLFEWSPWSTTRRLWRGYGACKL